MCTDNSTSVPYHKRGGCVLMRVLSRTMLQKKKSLKLNHQPTGEGTDDVKLTSLYLEDYFLSVYLKPWRSSKSFVPSF